ncbi:hypothetical protein ACFLSW_02760 [Candidatus Bipolaricaulota bacterium]
MKKKIARILLMVMVVGMMAAIPASTQILPGGGGESADDDNLSMLISINRLELSAEQMKELQDILTGLLEEKEGMDVGRAEFEDVMIEFTGTSEELDELLGAFREEQGAAAEALRESIETSLDAVRDLLSINQGIALREMLPELLGGGVSRGTDRGAGRLQNMSRMMESPMQSLPMGRGGMMMGQQAQRSGQMQSSAQGGTRMGMRGDSFESDAMPGLMMERLADAGTLQMRRERLGQDIDDLGADAMMEQMRDRFEQFGDDIPEELLQQMEERFGGAIQSLGARLGWESSGATNRMENRSGSAMVYRGGGNSRSVQRGQMLHRGQLAGHGDLFELLEQVNDVLTLKLDAVN